MAHLAQRFGFDLTDALASDFKADSDLFQRLWLPVEKSKALDEHGSFAIRKGRENFAHLVFQDRIARRFRWGFDRCVFEEVAELALAAIADFGLERNRV